MPIVELIFAFGEELLKSIGVKQFGHRRTFLRWLSLTWFPVVEFLVFWNDAHDVIEQSTQLEGGTLIAATAYMNGGGRLFHVVTCIAYLKVKKFWPILLVCTICHWFFNLTIEYVFTNRTIDNDFGLFGILSLPLMITIIASLPIIGYFFFFHKNRT